MNLFEFGLRALHENRVYRASCRQAAIDDPGKGLNPRATQFGLQLFGFEHGRRLGQRHDHDLSVRRIAQPPGVDITFSPKLRNISR